MTNFKIFNDGYENLLVKYEINDTMGDIPLKVCLYSDQLGVTKKVIKGHVSFRYGDRPLSFTKRIDFFGLNNQVYSIMVSGTTDNSILTNYAYIQRTPKYVFKIK